MCFTRSVNEFIELRGVRFIFVSTGCVFCHCEVELFLGCFLKWLVQVDAVMYL